LNVETDLEKYSVIQFFTEPNISTTPLPVTQKDIFQEHHILETSLPGFIKSFPNVVAGDELRYLKRKGALQIPQYRLRYEIFRSFLKFVYPYLPVIDVLEFLQAIYENGNRSVSLLLFQAVMFAGSAFVDIEYLISAGYSSRRAARKAFYQRAEVSSQILDVVD
jgi:hypothetical protein